MCKSKKKGSRDEAIDWHKKNEELLEENMRCRTLIAEVLYDNELPDFLRFTGKDKYRYQLLSFPFDIFTESASFKESNGATW